MKYDPENNTIELTRHEALLIDTSWKAELPYPQRLAEKMLERSIERIDEIANGSRGFGENALADLLVLAGLRDALSTIVQDEIQKEAEVLLKEL